MVSFFGLKFGGDRKKAQKQAAKDWSSLDQSTSTFSRQQARPATSHETQPPANWRTVFRGNGDNSSMVDLSPPMPRRPSIGSIRSWANTSSNHLPLPPFGGGPVRVGTPERPSTANARTREWVNPLDIHFAKDMVAQPVRLSEDDKGGVLKHVEISVKSSPVGEYVRATSRAEAESRATAGYPSPPASHVDEAASPTGKDSVSVAPSNSQGTLPSSLPSPALSGSRTSDDQWEPAAPRSLGKRDTTTFHTARRRSFTKETDTRPEELAKIRKTQQIEGFAGNFAAFDFGEEVRRQTIIDLPAPRLSAEDTPAVPKQSESPVSDTRFSLSPKATRKKAPAVEPEASNGLEKVYSLNLPTRKFSADRSTGLQRPATSHSSGNRRPSFREIPEGRRSSDVLDFARPGSARERADSDLMNSFPKPARPAIKIPTTDALRCHSPFGAPADLTGSYSVSVEGGNSAKSTPKSSFERTASPLPMKLGTLFSSAKNSLPRGRQPQAPRRPPRADEKTPLESETVSRPPEFSTPDWGVAFNAEDPRMSAMPAPLSARPRLGSGSTTASSPLALESPMVPDEAFQSLVLTLADVEDSFASTLDAALEQTSSYSSAGGSDFFTLSQPTMGSVTRVEAKKAPPRPAPITLPPSPSKAFGNGPTVLTPRSTTVPGLPTTFI